MAKSSRKFPIGVQTFSDIVLGNYYYVDKTGFVHKVAERYSYVFLNRPRRFGKSLLSSTFHCYFVNLTGNSTFISSELDAGTPITHIAKMAGNSARTIEKHYNKNTRQEELRQRMNAHYGSWGQ